MVKSGGFYRLCGIDLTITEIIEFPALVKAKRDRIVVAFYGGYRERHKAAADALIGWLDETGRNGADTMAGKSEDRGSI